MTPPTTTTATTKLNSGFQSLSLLSNKNGTHINSAVNQEKKTNTMQFGGSEKCARCQKAVYAAEKVVAASKFYHKLCYTCSTCKKMLSSMNCCDNSDGDIFCKCKIIKARFEKKNELFYFYNFVKFYFKHVMGNNMVQKELDMALELGLCKQIKIKIFSVVEIRIRMKSF